jgi:hypothetical protein
MNVLPFTVRAQQETSTNLKNCFAQAGESLVYSARLHQIHCVQHQTCMVFVDLRISTSSL